MTLYLHILWPLATQGRLVALPILDGFSSRESKFYCLFRHFKIIKKGNNNNPNKRKVAISHDFVKVGIPIIQ
jgi:hypothetical protein